MGYIIFLIAIILILTFAAVFVVQQQTVAVIERFGKFVRVATPGLNFMIPLIERKADILSLRIQQLDVPVETKTKDNVFVKIRISVQFKVIESKIYEAAYKLFSPAEQIEAYVFDVVRAKVPNIELDDTFSKKDEIAVDLMTELDEIMRGFGYEIIKALVTDIEPNENVKNAMNEINTAQRLRIAAGEKAEAEKILRVKQAEAEAEANILHGKGLAGQRSAIIDGLSDSLESIRNHTPGATSESIMSIILAIQYFDMLREIGGDSKSNTLFVSHSPDSGLNIKNQIMESILASAKVTDDLSRKK
jgi:regulator of protease activity HflC (stomatin/prohibitin superfamily)